MPEILSTGGIVVDLSADFRLRDSRAYPMYYHTEHPHPELLREVVYGLPELHREEIRTARLDRSPGMHRHRVDPRAETARLRRPPRPRARGRGRQDRLIRGRAGPRSGRSHAERSGVMRVYAAAGHRHTAEIEQETGLRVALSCHAVEAVRGSSRRATDS